MQGRRSNILSNNNHGSSSNNPIILGGSSSMQYPLNPSQAEKDRIQTTPLTANSTGSTSTYQRTEEMTSAQISIQNKRNVTDLNMPAPSTITVNNNGISQPLTGQPEGFDFVRSTRARTNYNHIRPVTVPVPIPVASSNTTTTTTTTTNTIAMRNQRAESVSGLFVSGSNRQVEERQPSDLPRGREGLTRSTGSNGTPLDVDYSPLLRTLLAVREGREGRGRIFTEIRNVLDLLRRADSVENEDLVFVHRIMSLARNNLYDRHRDMRLDVDNMSYEELLALGERIGNVNTGLTEEKIMNCLEQRLFLPATCELSERVEPCCICQEEYVQGAEVGKLECGHDFHMGCIKQWLSVKNACPICKTPAAD